MNYEPNTVHWKPGDIVVHDADAKKPYMLMRVTGYDREGLVVTRYVRRENERGAYHNELRYLHDPARFGIDMPLAEAQEGRT